MNNETTQKARRITTALSIQQPFAYLIVNGFKDIENRTWRNGFRGWIYVHAGKKFDQEGYDWVLSETDIALPLPHEFERGGIVGTARVSNCTTESDSPWFFGPYGYVLTHAEPVPFRPLRGRLGFFEVTP